MKKLLLTAVAALGVFVACEKDEFEALDTAFAQEITRLDAADDLLQSNINDLRNDFEAFVVAINAKIDAAVAALEAADQALEDYINAEIADLEAKLDAAVAALKSSIEDNTDLIKETGSELRKLIIAEAQARAAGDLEIANELADQVAKLEKADSIATRQIGRNFTQIGNLGSAIVAERSARIAADDALEVSISGVVSDVLELGTSLRAADAVLNDAIQSNDEDISGIQTINSGQNDRLQSLQASLTATISDLDDAVARIVIVEAFEAEIAAIVMRADQASTTISDLDVRLAGLDGTLRTFINTEDVALRNQLRGEITAAINTLDADLQAQIDSNDGDITALQGRADALQAAIDGLDIPAEVTVSVAGDVLTLTVSGTSYTINQAGGSNGASFDASLFTASATDTAEGKLVVISYDGTELTSFTVANGEDGDDGEDGDTGATGATGATGPQGPIGPQGPAGPSGTGSPTVDATDTGWINNGNTIGGLETFTNDGSANTEYSYDGGSWGSLSDAQAAADLAITDTGSTTVQINTRSVQPRLRQVTAVYQPEIYRVLGNPDGTEADGDTRETTLVTAAVVDGPASDDINPGNDVSYIVYNAPTVDTIPPVITVNGQTSSFSANRDFGFAPIVISASSSEGTVQYNGADFTSLEISGLSVGSHDFVFSATDGTNETSLTLTVVVADVTDAGWINNGAVVPGSSSFTNNGNAITEYQYNGGTWGTLAAARAAADADSSITVTTEVTFSVRSRQPRFSQRTADVQPQAYRVTGAPDASAPAVGSRNRNQPVAGTAVVDGSASDDINTVSNDADATYSVVKAPAGPQLGPDVWTPNAGVYTNPHHAGVSFTDVVLNNVIAFVAPDGVATANLTLADGTVRAVQTANGDDTLADLIAFIETLL